MANSHYVPKLTLRKFSENTNDLAFKPNIVFKVKSGINFEKDTPTAFEAVIGFISLIDSDSVNRILDEYLKREE